MVNLGHAKLPKIGELRHPITLVKPSSVPDDHDGMDLTLTPIWRGWAKVVLQRSRQHQETLSMGQGVKRDTSRDVTHKVTVRNAPGMYMPAENDFVVYGENLLRVIDCRELDPRGFYWEVICNTEGCARSWKYDNPETLENPNDKEEPTEERGSSDGFPFWS